MDVEDVRRRIERKENACLLVVLIIGLPALAIYLWFTFGVFIANDMWSIPRSVEEWIVNIILFIFLSLFGIAHFLRAIMDPYGFFNNGQSAEDDVIADLEEQAWLKERRSKRARAEMDEKILELTKRINS